MKAATLSPSRSRIPQPALYPLQGLTKTSTRKTAVLVGLCFLVATFTFATGSALIHSHFSSGTSRDGTLLAGVLLLACTGPAAVTNGLATRSALTPHTRLRSQAYLILRAVECLTIVAIGGYFLTSRTQWNASVLPVYVVSGAAGLILSSALWTSRLVPRNVSMLGLIGYPVFLAGTVLAMFNLIHVTHGAGMLALVPGGLFELILPIWLLAKGFASPRIRHDSEHPGPNPSYESALRRSLGSRKPPFVSPEHRKSSR